MVNTFLADDKSGGGSINVRLVLTEPVKSENDVKALNFRHWCAQCAGQYVHGDCEGQCLVVYQEYETVCHLNTLDA